MKNFTFKCIKPTGRYRSFDNDYHDIKLSGKKVGCISAPEHRSLPWSIRFAVNKGPTVNDPAPFRWVTLQVKFDTPQDAKRFARDRFERIVS